MKSGLAVSHCQTAGASKTTSRASEFEQIFISYKQIEEFQNSWSRASDDFEKRQALEINNIEWTHDNNQYQVLVGNIWDVSSE